MEIHKIMKKSYLRRRVLSLFVLSILSISAIIIGQNSLFSKQVTPSPLPVIDWTAKTNSDTKAFDTLLKEQKYEAATKLAEQMLISARSEKKSEKWVQALIRLTQLRIALHGYETAVRRLKEETWPEDLFAQTMLNLYYARALTDYIQRYSWEIRKRERIDSKGPIDLKAWSLDQLVEEIQKVYFEAWKHRAQLGEYPISDMAEYITENSYPRKIRSTLRDALAYLWVENLANTANWKPGESHETYLLPFNTLAGTNNKKLDPSILSNPSSHSLMMVIAILDDLEAWHLKNDRVESALEARIVRLEKLHQNFTNSEKREVLKNLLQSRLTRVKKVPWWSRGMATLAEWVRQEQSADNLIRAREIAVQCHERYPKSFGGGRCLSILKTIESADFQLEGMASDSLKKRSLAVKHKNIEKIHFRAYKIDLEKYVKSANDYSLYPNNRELVKILKEKTPAQQWEADLPETRDYKMHNTFVSPPIDKNGVYLIVASAKKDFSEKDNKMLGLFVSFGDLVLVGRHEDGRWVADLFSGSSGEPFPGVEVVLYEYNWRKGHKLTSAKITDAHGRVQFKKQGTDHQNYFLLAQKGDQTALVANSIYLSNPPKHHESSAALIYTDRSIYRPNQKIKFKAVVYQGRRDLGTFKTSPKTRTTIKLLDANGEVVKELKLRTNTYGTVSGEFVIPSGRLLGTWSIQSTPNGYAQVRVEEYKRPTFEVKIEDPTAPMRLNRPATVTGESLYYFGLPLTDAKVLWKVERTPVYPWWWSTYWRWGGYNTQGVVVETGVSQVDENGKFSMAFTPKADRSLARTSKDIQYRYVLTADVTDEGGETRSATRSFMLGFVAVQANLQSEKHFFTEDQAGKVTIVRTDLNGIPSPGKSIYRLLKVVEPKEALLPADQPFPKGKVKSDSQKYETPGDKLRPRWLPSYQPEALMRDWSDGETVSKGRLKHNDKGEAEISLPLLKSGIYRIHFETRDAFGEKYEMAKEVFIIGKKDPIELPAVLWVEKDKFNVGETAKIYVASGLDNQPVYFDIFREGRQIERRKLESSKMKTLIEIPVTEQDRGGFSVSLVVLRDHQFVQIEKSIFVPWDNKELQVSFSTFRDKLRPGSKEKWRLKVSGPGKKDKAIEAAEVLSYMYDKSLDSFGPHHFSSPLSLYPNRIRNIGFHSTIGRAQNVYLRSYGLFKIPSYGLLRGDQLNVHSGYGIGGGGRRGRHRRNNNSNFVLAEGVDGTDKNSEQGSVDTFSQDDALAAPRKKSSLKMDVAQKALLEKSKGIQNKSPSVPDAGPEIELRTNFSETAFWEPHLLTNKDGSATLEFTVPDSLTTWNVWVHAITKDLKSGSISKEAKTVKDLMVRPYLPRFLREGDKAELVVTVNNSSEKILNGNLSFDILNPDTEKSLIQEFGLDPKETQRSFSAPAKGSVSLRFPVTAPHWTGMVAIKVTAVSGDFSDGELRPIPILPSRVHLAQSRFAVLKNKSTKKLVFLDLLKDDDSTRINDQLVVTIDGQLFYSVLSALPYLINYPYECTEQTLNRFLSTAILSSLYKDYPAIQKMAKKLLVRKTRLESWDSADPNRKMLLAETPWVTQAKGGKEKSDQLSNVLNPKVTKAQRKKSLAKLKKSQTSSGGFPWFSGGAPSPYMTLYTLHGLSKALEFGIDVPKPMVQKGWSYLHRHYIDAIVNACMGHDGCWEFVTFMNYVLSNYPDTSWTGKVFSQGDRVKMLNYSFKHWKEHSPYLKGYLALTLKRMGRPSDAKLVWESVMDSAKETEDQGTFWAPEDRSWLWYNDTIETHAFAIRTVMELTPKDKKLDGLVLWMMLNKKLNHWKSTRATAEAIYSLAHYLKATGQLGLKEVIDVKVGDRSKQFVFNPEEYTGKKNQVVITKDDIDPKKDGTTVISKKTKGYAFASATWHFSTERSPKEAHGDFMSVKRTYFKRIKTGKKVVLQPLKEGAQITLGDEVEVHLSLRTKHEVEYVHLRDPRPAGFEPATSVSRHKWNLGISWYEEIRDSGTNFFFEKLPVGEYPFKYRLRAATAGTFKSGPATVQPMYAPEFTAYSSGDTIKIGAGVD